jgi:hypothetical protein
MVSEPSARRPDLRHVRARIEAAEREFSDLGTRVNRAFNARGDPVTLRFKPDAKRDAMLVYVADMFEIDPQWSHDIAHILYDCRSSLDQIVWQLYLASKGEAPTERLARLLAFPIARTERAWQEQLAGHRLDGIDAEFVGMIEAVQPYHRPAHVIHALVSLARLNDLDKHRAPHLMVFGADSLEVQVVKAWHCRPGRTEFLHDLLQPLQIGTVLARVPYLPDGTGNPKLQVRCEGPVQPTFEDRVPVRDALVSILMMVKSILNDFERALKLRSGSV